MIPRTTHSPADISAIPQSEFDELAAVDTCSVANAIERFGVRLRNEGYTEGEILCRFPESPPIFGYAFTLQVRTSAPPTKGKVYLENPHWWDALLVIPRPRVLVLQDMDYHPGVGALVGEVHAHILKALGCIGVVTNGAVRDLPRVKGIDFQMYSQTLSVSHSYSHIVHIGAPVHIGGLEISVGDLLHGDCHGIVRVPRELAGKIPASIRAQNEKEARIIDYCQSPNFSVEKLRNLLHDE